MKTLPIKILSKLRSSYEERWYNALVGDAERVDYICTFIEKHDEYQLTYTQAFFSLCAINVYELAGKKKLFNAPEKLFGEAPLSVKDAEGNWMEWLKKAKKVAELR